MEITIETDGFLIPWTLRQPRLIWCAACAREVKMITPEEAAAVAGVTERAIYGWTEAGKVHFTETPSGLLLICLASLPSGSLQGEPENPGARGRS